ncbi:C-type lectin domain family 12 member B-like [Emydura macquarii macquarii]|uniref:C-type lectin domain family 12 member B-like n=1 Tax=Emydura macquarii macquarii TaxID=1129001 RepID=UPI00352ADCCE
MTDVQEEDGYTILNQPYRNPVTINISTSKNQGPICTLCPANWQWVGGNSCFYISKQKETWQQSQKFCSSQNSTLFMLKEKKKLEHIPQLDKNQYYWIGLSYKPDGWFWVDNTALSTKRQDWIVLSYDENCAYLYYHRLKVYNSKNCNTKYPWICEKAAVQMT